MLLALTSLSFAQDCNVRDLKKGLVEANPSGIPAAFDALAACDATAAKAAAPVAFERVLSGEGGNQLVLAAVEVQAWDTPRDWITGLQSDERSRTIAALGAACTDAEEVAGFLVYTQTKLGDAFWTDRWYRSLAECRHEAVQEMLSTEVAKGNADRARYFGVLEVYSRNLGAEAIPLLSEQLATMTDEEDLTYLVNAFADAAHVGSLDGQDEEATKLAIDAIVSAAPTLPARAVEQARTTLISLGDEDAANQLVAVRYQDVKRDDGLHWGVVAVETGVCKKDTRVNIHTGEAIEGGTMWPDQVAAGIDAATTAAWEFPLAKKCEVTTVITVSDQPMSADGLDAWTREQVREATKAGTAAGVAKIATIAEESAVGF